MHASFDTALAIPAVRFAGVARHFGAVKAVDGVDLSILPGEFFAMLGPSGSGKTTCLRLIAGFEQPDAGHIEIFGEKVEGLPPYRRAVNTVFQDYALFLIFRSATMSPTVCASAASAVPSATNRPAKPWQW